MDRFLLFTLCFSLFTLYSHAQEICNNNIDDDNDGFIDFGDCDCENKRGNVWHFGGGYGIDFNTTPPTPFISSMESAEAASSICDEDGNLLFYSNGGGRLPDSGQDLGTIWDRNGDVMYNMMGREGGGFSARNGCVIIKKPNSVTNYYIFTMEEAEFNIDGDIPGQFNGRGLSCFEVDMSANAGLGEVVLADQRLYVPSFEVLAAIEHDNGEDYWIIIKDGGSSSRNFIVFLATENGVQQAGSYSFPVAENDFYTILKISPDRRKIGEWSNQNVAFIDFDPSTGEMSNRIQVSQADFRAGDFSPSGRYFYGLQIDNTNNIIRIDLSNLSTSSTFENIGSYTAQPDASFNAFQLGPQESIYFLNSIGFGAIRCPDSSSPAIEPEVTSLMGNPDSDFFDFILKFPNYPNHYFFKPFIPLDITGESAYDMQRRDSITLTIQTSKCADILWNTGATTSETTITEPGTYTVTATDNCEQFTFEVVVTDSLVSSTNELSIESDLKFFTFPNPTTSATLYVDYSAVETGAVDINVYNVTGVLLKTQNEFALTGQQTFPIDIATLPAGSYFIELNNGKSRGISKFTVQ